MLCTDEVSPLCVFVCDQSLLYLPILVTIMLKVYFMFTCLGLVYQFHCIFLNAFLFLNHIYGQ